MPDPSRKTGPSLRNISIAQILSYRLPPAGRVSILHRMSGALLFILLPFSLYLFEQSLTSEISFAVFKGLLSNPAVKLIVLVIAWAFSLHWIAGLRHLLMDMHVAVNQQGGRMTAYGVLGLSSLLTAVIAAKLFGVF